MQNLHTNNLILGSMKYQILTLRFETMLTNSCQHGSKLITYFLVFVMERAKGTSITKQISILNNNTFVKIIKKNHNLTQDKV
jgi:hypothetical protein